MVLKAPWLDEFKNGTDLITCDNSFTSDGNELPLPSHQLRKTVSRPDLPGFYFIAETWAHQLNKILCNVKLKNPRAPLILDIGCGVGKTARFLAMNPKIKYVGFDIFQPAIEWANKFLVPEIGKNFKFIHYDGVSDFYNPSGTIEIEDFEFPVKDGSVDILFAASLFTHLREKDCISYLQQTKKKMAKNGRALYSIKEPADNGDDFVGSEAAMKISVNYFDHLCRSEGLRVVENIGSLAGQTGILLAHE